MVNPARRELDRQLRSLRSKLTQSQAHFGALELRPEADLRDLIEQLENELTTVKQRRASTPKHLAWEDLSEPDKFERLAPSRKQLTDAVKMLAYRAETALARIVQEKLAHPDEARSLIRDLFRSDADIHPDEAAGVLNIRLHTLANPRSNRVIQHLVEQLNAAAFKYPGTEFRLTYTLCAPRPTDSVVSC